MKIIRTFSLVSFAVVLATPAFASFGGGGKSEPTPSRASGASAAEGTEAAATARQDDAIDRFQ